MKLSLRGTTKNVLISVFIALLMGFFGLHFILNEGVQLKEVGNALGASDRRWLYLGGALAFVYIWLHGQMYRMSFRALGIRVRSENMTRLFLKRNLFSVFLPAGFLSSQAFFTSETAKIERVRERDVALASGIFSAAALLSMIMVVAPALGWLLTQQVLPGGAVEAFLVVSGLFSLLLLGVVSFVRGGRAYRWGSRYFPAFAARIQELDWLRFETRYFINAILYSCMVELVGIWHVYIAVKALGMEATWAMAVAGYMAVLVVLMTSPFLRGMGAVEAMLGIVLIHVGLPAVEAVSAAILFRFFEFWLILILAAPVFLFRPGSLLLRVSPSILLFALGVVNILSGLTPSLPVRIQLLRNYLPLSAIHASVALTIVLGFFLLTTAFYLFQGWRSAWYVALGLSAVSLVSHLAKGFDYEESTLALLTIGSLVYQRNEYNVRTDMGLVRRRWLPALIVVTTALLLGATGFYGLDHRHFGQDFTWQQSLYYAIQTFLLQQPEALHPSSRFGVEFMNTMYLLGGITLLYAAFILFRPLFPQMENTDRARETALAMVRQYGRSSLDYFKTYADKQYFFPQNGQSFVSYKNTRRYALVLEDPVAPDEEDMVESITEFDRYCHRNGLRSIYYRIPEASTALYRQMGKSLLPLGQEAVVNLTQFSLDGKDRKAMRNTIHKMEREGFVFRVHEAPLEGRVLQQLRAVSDAWLRMLHRSELNFSQGVFDESELKKQTVLTMEDAEGKILSFINLIPGASASEANFDMMRRVEEAPNGTMDFMFVNMFRYLQAKGFETCNLGLVPMSGLQRTSSLPENLIKMAYERMPRFAAYKSLRYFKEKFDPVWETKYVAFDSQLDLVNLPAALAQVVRS